MPCFKYIGGLTTSDHYSEISDENGNTVTTDERHGVEMPDVTKAFGIKFIIGQPVEVTPEMFDERWKFEHALKKLRLNRYFEEVKGEPAKPEKARAA